MMIMQNNPDIKSYSDHNKSDMTLKLLTISFACNLLQRAKVRNCDLLSNGSNYVFLVTLVKEGAEVKAIYKPRQGEDPLWDFPDGTLYKREYAAFIVSQALDWNLVPPTVIRSGPYGVGSMQWFIDTPARNEPQPQLKDAAVLKQVALFDYLVNNADRKAGHFLVDRDCRLWLIDHGLTFSDQPKLRTVLWDFSGQPVPEKLLSDVRALQPKLRSEKHLHAALSRLLGESEIEALELRIKAILEKPVFVYPGRYRSIPWPWY
jgi:hypothetical protein